VDVFSSKPTDVIHLLRPIDPETSECLLDTRRFGVEALANLIYEWLFASRDRE